MTADAKAVRAAIAQGINFSVYIHNPCPLTGNKWMQLTIAPY